MKKLISLILAALLALAMLTSALADTYTDKDTVKSVQQALNDAGYNCGTPDGIAGKNTAAAIIQYQTDHGLAATGAVDDALLAALGLRTQTEADAATETQTPADPGISITSGLPLEGGNRILTASMGRYELKKAPDWARDAASADIVYEMEWYWGGYTRSVVVWNGDFPTLVRPVENGELVRSILTEYCGATIVSVLRDDTYNSYQSKSMRVLLVGNSPWGPADADGGDVPEDAGAFYAYLRDGSDSKYLMGCLFERVEDQIDWSSLQYMSPLKFNESYTVPEGKPGTFVQASLSSNSSEYGERVFIWDDAAKKYMVLYRCDEDVYYSATYGDYALLTDGVTGERLTFDNVIVQTCGKIGTDPSTFQFVGSGNCDYFVAGKHFSGTWTRSGEDANTVYRDDSGNEVRFNPGKTFICVVEDGRMLYRALEETPFKDLANAEGGDVAIPEAVIERTGGFPDSLDALADRYDIDALKMFCGQWAQIDVIQTLVDNGTIVFDGMGLGYDWNGSWRSFVYLHNEDSDDFPYVVLNPSVSEDEITVTPEEDLQGYLDNDYIINDVIICADTAEGNRFAAQYWGSHFTEIRVELDPWAFGGYDYYSIRYYDNNGYTVSLVGNDEHWIAQYDEDGALQEAPHLVN